MLISFEITMPNVGSWNGQWSSANKAHFKFLNLPKKEVERLLQGTDQRNFYYNFGDGWGANVSMKITTSKEKKKIERNNNGFMGYDWMVDSIIKHGQIQC